MANSWLYAAHIFIYQLTKEGEYFVVCAVD